MVYLNNIWKGHEILSRLIEGNPDIARLDGDPEDYIKDPKKSGYRGLHQGILIKIKRKTYFPLELQLLTVLQFDWTEKEHLVYDNRNKIPPEIKEELFALSTTFHSISSRVMSYLGR